MARSKTIKKSRKKNRSFGCFLFGLFLKIALIGVIFVIGYGIYLDQKIRQRIDGQVWDLPAAVYGQVVELDMDSTYSQKEIIEFLNDAQYRQVSSAIRPGEYVVSANSIELYRRPFQFPDAKEDAFRAKLYFVDNQLSQIQNMETNRNFGFFRIDPRLISMMQSVNGELRLFMPLNDFSELLTQTLIATEDRRFYRHDGVSLYSIGRAFVANLMAGRTVQGGSTLTQQLVKNLFLSDERTLIRKINEAYMALILDSRYGKDRVLELYLNEVYLGQDGDDAIHGFPLASQYYFGRPVNELSLDQQALLVGMVKGASYYNPWRHPERTIERRNVVLKLLEEQRVIDNELYVMLSKRPLGVLPKGGVLAPQPAFMQLVRTELQEKLGENTNILSGAKIFTTFDSTAQFAAEKAVVDGVETLRKAKKIPDLEAAMIVANRTTGEVKAVVGGSKPQFAGFNRALSAKRSIGSLAKPSTYLTALSDPNKYRLNSILKDEPLTLPGAGGKPWSPKNVDRRFRGEVTLLKALASSINVPTVNLGLAIGLDSSARVLKELGVPADAIQPYAARLLGAMDLSLLDVTQMFQTIGNIGSRSPLSALRAVIGEDGKVIYQSYPQSHQVLSAQASYLTLFAMQKVIESGTARSLNAQYGQYHLAGKTGTTNDYRDSWFVGIDGRDVVSAWVGRDDHSPTKLTGSTGALVIYRNFLNLYKPEVLNPTIPEDIHMMAIDSSGRFICNSDTGQAIPVWTSNSSALCRSEQYIQQQTQEQQSKQSGNEAPKWLKEMFTN